LNISKRVCSQATTSWRPGFPDWKSVSEISDFWLPPNRTAQAQPRAAVEAKEASTPSAGRKWSLWKGANVGLVFGAFLLLLQIANGRGFELAGHAHTANVANIAYIFGEVIFGPLFFVSIAAVRNLIYWRQPKSNVSAATGAVIFGTLFVSIFAAIMLYGEVFFQSTEKISGELRKRLIADTHDACVRKQRSLNQNVTDAQIEKYCACISTWLADYTTYRDAGGATLDELKQRAELAGNACR
jgi:uncharacterized integral membrane protein